MIERVSFDVAQMASDDYLVGIAYQQGPLYQQKLRSFIFGRSNGKCVYCGAQATEIDHVIPRSNGGTNSTYNLVASCRACNKKKSNLSLKDFGKLVGKDFSHLKPKKLPRDAAVAQSIREYTIRKIKEIIPNTISYGSWMTKYNRNKLGLPKEHYYDALSVGNIQDYKFLTDKALIISAKGRGYIVKAIVTKGSKKGEYLGRVAVRSNKNFNIQTKTKTIQGIGYKYCHIIQRCDGYLYDYKECDFLSGKNNRVSVAK